MSDKILEAYKDMSSYFMDSNSLTMINNYFGEWTHGLNSFVCHESHVDVVLDMLRGYKGQCRLVDSNQAWSDCNLGIKGEWSADFWYTSDKFESRIVATV